MPYTEKQMKLFRAVAHGWKPRNKGITLTKKDAKKLVHEGTSYEQAKAMERK